jgi:hypothetical protein
MRRDSGIGRKVAWAIAVGSVAAIWLLWGPPGNESRSHDEEAAPRPRRAQPIDLEMDLGIKDKEQVPWNGSISVQPGKVTAIEIIRAAMNSTVEGADFKVRAKRDAQQGQNRRQNAQAQAQKAQNQNAPQKEQDQNGQGQNARQQRRQNAQQGQVRLVSARLRVLLDAPPHAKVTVTTSHGDFNFALADMRPGDRRNFLEGQAAVTREEVATPLTGKDTEDDYPVMARAPKGGLWAAYVAYRPGAPLVNERVLSGQFDALVPHGNGDQVRLMHFVKGEWGKPIDVTEAGLDVWRPTVAVGGKGAVWVTWAQKVEDDWELMSRRYMPAEGEGTWSKIERLTKVPGTDIHVVSTTDSKGRVWLAWQAWRDGNYDILSMHMGEDGWSKPQTVSTSGANDWGPSIAADGEGRVYIAWDTYDRGNYDVELAVLGSENRTLGVARSARFEARAHLTCDADNRLWVAYEEGDEQWGKDFLSAKEFNKVGFDRNPGFALYQNRTVKVKCLADGNWQQTAADLDEAWGENKAKNKSCPRLGLDAEGAVWLLVRYHPVSLAAGEVWKSFATRYNGQKWESARHLPSSENLMDNRPALAAHGRGLMVVYSGDGRTKTADRQQDDLYAAVLATESKASAPELKPADPDPPAEMTDVHPNEIKDVEKMRSFRLSIGGKELRLVRGEFHRHTELTCHNDGDGLLEDTLRYAQDAGKLDWMGSGDHDNGGGHEYMWWLVQKNFDMHTHPQEFTGAMSYERSVVYPNGHRNVIMPRRGIRPLPRGELKGTPEEGTPDTKILYAYLKHFGGMCASHTSGTNMGTDWRDNDPDVEPVVEIYQGHRHNYEHFGAPRSATAETQIGGYQPAGFIWNALEKGYRLGFESSSDHVSTHISYGALFVENNSRQAIIDAFKARHCYAATDNIVLVVRMGDHLMGDKFETSERPTFEIEAHGTAPIAKLHIVRDNKYIYNSEPGKQQFHTSFTDQDAQPGKQSYYYVRIEQADQSKNLAWASPMWITYNP